MTISRIIGERPVFDPPPPTPLTPAALPGGVSHGPFLQAMRKLGREIDVGEAQVAGASRLHDYDPGTLIALQAGIYRYSEAVDLASKIVDRVSSGVRTVLQGSGH